ncbi:MAG: sacsin N-terminal ATP-binding-like domain-containing protein, partial [Vulcanibacillus sp.]
MGQINYKAINELNKDEWKALTREPQKYEALLAGHYSDSNHFVYELLQNAEDARATKVVFEYYKEKLVFYHNGKPFDENDVKGVSSMLMGTKDLNSAQTIGKFGMGFKSVYKYTYQPEIYSDNEAFRIENYLLPVVIINRWNYNKEKKSLVYPLNSRNNFSPFINDKHLTKIIIPFAKKDVNANIVNVKGDDVLKKLQDLNGEILLFLKYIKKLYWVDKTTNKYALISLDETKNDSSIKTCRIEGTDYGNKEDITKYIKFTKLFNHPDMKDANVSVAYKINTRANNINEMSNTNVWVYFPTKDETKFPFLVHGSFETAVSREKLMEPSVYNQDIFNKLGDLICESLLELRDRNLITQMFIRRILLVAMQDERISNLRERITNTFLENNLLPDKAGNFKKPDELCIAIPFEIADFIDKELFKESFFNIKPFVQFNNIKEINFTEYFNWLIDDLHISIFNLELWANKLSKYNSQKIETGGDEYDSIKEFYRFLSEYRENSYIINRSSYGNYYIRSGFYERKIRECLSEAWKLFRISALILNANGKLVAAFKGIKENIYLNSLSQYKNVIKSALVDKEVANEFETLFKDGFHILDFNNFQYVKEKIVKKYIDIEDTIKFDNP